MQDQIVKSFSLFSDYDIELLKSGKHFKLYEKFGAHQVEVNGVAGYYFATWAPSAEKISVIGDFNAWNDQSHPLFVRWDSSGVWEGFIPGLESGELYKFKIWSKIDNQVLEKSDPYAYATETPPKTASVSYMTKHKWADSKWMKNRKKKNSLSSPMSIYEIHLGSWKRHPDNSLWTYKEIAQDLADYVIDMGFTHVELMPVMEHPYAPSWGYQITGFFAPSSRFGTPDDFKYMIDILHQEGIGVILDWVPAHFPADAWALAEFDGTHVYEHPDRKKGYHPDWKSLIFNYERNEVRAFLISSALYWLDQFHIDGLRVDAVASMIYLDYSREDGEWEPNEFGGREYLAAISLLKEFNEAVYHFYPDVVTIAEESTSYPLITKPVHDGGLGFGMKWMMGWMNDTLGYFKRDTIYRKYHQNDITFSMVYAFSENFMLPFSHDEVVHGKQSLVYKMPGDEWQKFANLRALYGYMFTHPGAKLLFMGNEFAQTTEWNFKGQLNWDLTQYDSHAGVLSLVRDLNMLYKKEEALYAKNYEQGGFEWVDHADAQNSIMSYLRIGNKPRKPILVIINFSTKPQENYRIGVPHGGTWKVLINTDSKKYWGSDLYKDKSYLATKTTWHNKKQSIEVNIPPMGVLVLK